MNLLKIYDFGVTFLEKHPCLKEGHNQLKKVIIQFFDKKYLTYLLDERKKKSEESLKCSIAVQFMLALLFLIPGLWRFFAHFSLLGLLVYLVYSVVFYVFGVLNSESLKQAKIPTYDKLTEVKKAELKTEEIKSDHSIKPDKKEKKKEKTLRNRIYDGINTLCVWGWVYFCLMKPDALKKWLAESKIMEYIPHEKDVISTWNETHLLFGGIFLIPVVFWVIRIVLKGIAWILKVLFSKQNIREL